MVLGRIDEQGTEEFLQTPTKEMKSFWKRYQIIKSIQYEKINAISMRAGSDADRLGRTED